MIKGFSNLVSKSCLKSYYSGGGFNFSRSMNRTLDYNVYSKEQLIENF